MNINFNMHVITLDASISYNGFYDIEICLHRMVKDGFKSFTCIICRE